MGLGHQRRDRDATALPERLEAAPDRALVQLEVPATVRNPTRPSPRNRAKNRDGS